MDNWWISHGFPIVNHWDTHVEQIILGICGYPLVFQHSHGKWPIEIDGLPIKHGDFPWLC